jgi:uncharacterized protein (DUF983 family)
MFRAWFSMNSHCSECELEFEGKPGDTWGFWVFTDRAFLFVILAALYLGFTPESWLVRIAFFVTVAGALVATMPHRQGAFIALDYMARTRWP